MNVLPVPVAPSRTWEFRYRRGTPLDELGDGLRLVAGRDVRGPEAWNSATPPI